MRKKLSSCKKTNAVLNYIWSEFEANGEGNVKSKRCLIGSIN